MPLESKKSIATAAAIVIAGFVAAVFLDACTKSAPATESAAPAAAHPVAERTAAAGPPPGTPAAGRPPPGTPAATSRGLKLSPDDIAKLGIALTPASAAQYLGGIEGFAVVVGRDVIVQALTDVVTARAAARQSHAASARIERLAGTAGADSAAVRETAERQSVADDAAVELAEAKASSVLGHRSPWMGAGGAGLIQSLRAGRIEVVRISFPLGSFTIDDPRRLRLRRLDHRTEASSWSISRLWDAPADSSMPGHSYFAVVETSNLAEGERLLAWATAAASPSAHAGVLIPASSVVISDDKYWCYTQGPNDTFTRMLVDVDRPQAGGYFVSDGIKPGDLVVTSGAGLLLARDTNPAVDADP
jgi:hypothetical protein